MPALSRSIGLHVGPRVASGSGGTPTPTPTAPAAISDLTATAQSDTEVLLAYTPASGATSHQYRVDGGSATSVPGDKIITGLAAETEYDFEVRGVNGAGNGAWSNVATATTEATPILPPGAIDDLSATAVSSSQINLLFTVASGATTHEYRVDGGSWQASGDGNQSVGSLDSETEYDFEVRGVNTGGNGPASNIATEATLAASVESRDPPILDDPPDFVSGTNPPITAVEYPEGTIPGDWIVRQTANNNLFTDAYEEEQEFTFEIATLYDPEDPDTYLSWNPAGVPASGPVYIREKVQDAPTVSKTVESIWSNVWTDTLDTASAPALELVAHGSWQKVNGGFGYQEYTVEDVPFQAGIHGIAIRWGDSRTIDDVGGGMFTAAVAQGTGGGIYTEFGAAVTKDVVIDWNNAIGEFYYLPFTIINASGATVSDTAVANEGGGSGATSIVTSSALTVPDPGLGVAMMWNTWGDSNQPGADDVIESSDGIMALATYAPGYNAAPNFDMGGGGIHGVVQIVAAAFTGA